MRSYPSCSTDNGSAGTYQSPHLCADVIWLISYPRSGNTFLRNVLYEVYGLASATYHLEAHGPDEGWDGYPVVKSHLLPHQLPKSENKRRIVYLIRDGRDAVVSMAHHRSDVVAPGSSFENNLHETILAAGGSHFGGWSAHVEAWLSLADVVIRFEDLVADPLAQCERLRALMELPAPRRDRLPGFETLRNGNAEYGSGRHLGMQGLSAKWFRRGKVNGWKDEMPETMHDLFWHLHGEVMEIVGYGLDGGKAQGFKHLGLGFRIKAGLEPTQETYEIQVLVEAGKLTEPFVDGIKRYVMELLRLLAYWQPAGIKVHSFVAGRIAEPAEALLCDGSRHRPVPSGLLSILKRSARVVLPETIYSYLARNISLQRLLPGWNRPPGRGVSLPERGLTGVLHLSLPQHFEAFQTWRGPVVATIHDMTHTTHPQTHEDNNVRLAHAGMQWLKARDPLYIAVSENTRADLLAAHPEARVYTIAEGVDRRHFHPVYNAHLLALVRDLYHLPAKKFLLSVSTLEPRKNLTNVIGAYARLPKALRDEYHLVLAGRKGWKWTTEAIPGHCREQVHFTGFVREDHLPALYTLAHGFCYLSLYEGFGLPVLEAMACRCPVIASNNSSLPEIAGTAALLVNPLDENEISTAMSSLCTDEARRNELALKGQRQSWNFTWSRCAEGTIEVYLAAATDANNSAQKRRKASFPPAG